MLETRRCALRGREGDEMSKKRSKGVATLLLSNIKESDAFFEMLSELGLGDNSEIRDAFFDCGEYATIEIRVDESLNIIGGRFLQKSEW